MTEFIFFGCWNNVDCEHLDSYNYRDIVLDYIKQYENNVPYLFLAGDNWYSNAIKGANKPKSNKYYLTSVLQSGYNKIYDLNKETRIVLGNHDVNTDNTPDEKKKDCMLNTQKYYLDKPKLPQLIDAPTLDNINGYKSNSTKSKKSNKHIILHEDVEFDMIDNVYILYINTNVFFTNYVYIDDEINKIRNKLFEIEKQNKETQYPIIIMGHHPILSLETKKDKPKLTNICEYCENSFDNLYDLLTHFNCIYICADTHNFQLLEIGKHNKQKSVKNKSLQSNKIKMKVPKSTNSVSPVSLNPPVLQTSSLSSLSPSHETKYSILEIVSGTGGGEPRKICNAGISTRQIQYKMKNKDYEYTMNGYGHNSFGYTKIKVINKTNILLTYVQIITSETPQNNNVLHHTYNIVNINKQWTLSRQTKTSIIKGSNIVKYDRDIDLSNYINAKICKQIIPEDFLKYTVKNGDLFCFKK